MNSPGCALCGRAGVYRRVDLTYGEIDPRDTSDFAVLSVMRGVLICPECMISARLADVLNVAGGGVGIVHGCLVQCVNRPPWWLRGVLPGQVPIWRKVSCPACSGRATVQMISEVTDRPRGAIREGFRQALGVLSLRRGPAEGDWDAVDTSSYSGPDRAAPDGLDSQDVAVARDHPRPERTARSRDHVESVPAGETQITGGGGGYVIG